MLRRIRIRRRYAVSPFPLPASSYDNTLTDIIALHTEIARLPRTMFVWKYSGIGSVLLYTCLRRIPQSLTDAAKMDGAGPLKTYLLIRLPCIVSEIALTCGVYIMFLMGIYKESYLLFGAYPSQKVYMLQNYMNHQYTNMNFQYVAASAVLLILLSCMLYAFIHLLRTRRQWL